MDKPIPEAVDLLALEGAADYLAGRYSERDGWVQSIRAAIRALTAAQQQGGGDLNEVVCLACGDNIMPMGQVCHACSHPVSAPPSAPVGVEGNPCAETACAMWTNPSKTAAEDAAFMEGFRTALAQQPAAVDEGMAQRIMSEFHANDPGDVWPPDEQGRLRRKALQDAINNALATQHQEPPHDRRD